MNTSLSKRLFTRRNVVIVAAKRTPIGSFMGTLSNFTASQLGVVATKGALLQANLKGEDVEEVYYGNVMQAGQGQAPARQVCLGSGIKVDTPCTTINKVCSSGMKSVMLGAMAIALGDRNIVVAGGMESMSKIPHLIYLRKPTGYGPAQITDGIQFDCLTDVYNNILMGNCTEKIASEMGISREAQDKYANESYLKARKAQDAGIFDWEIVGVTEVTKKGEVVISKDEECQKYFPDKAPNLKPAFKKDGTITAFNASKMNDAACTLVLMDEQSAKDRGLKPLARIVNYEDAAVQPIDFGIAPALATTKLLKKTKMSINDIHCFEYNEAFSTVALANMKLLDIDPSKVNIHGGAVALGHPLGASGARIILSLINSLRVTKQSIGVAAICNGGGGSSSIMIERLN